jgi:hypothetical protein
MPTQRSGTISDLPKTKDGLTEYLHVFLEGWNRELAPDGELAWQTMSPSFGAPLLAVYFTTRYKNGPHQMTSEALSQDWNVLLTKLDENSKVHANSSRIYIDTFFRHISDRQIFFIKRNEQRFWTRTAAREDVESTLTHLMNTEGVFGSVAG